MLDQTPPPANAARPSGFSRLILLVKKGSDPYSCTRAAVLLLALTGWSGAAGAQTFTACVGGLKQSAVRAGVSPALAARALSLTAPDEKVLRLSSIQPEFDIPIWDYMSYLVD
jgi:membrane-bound lytic murein transglycosylase B